jgi:hypothetical protein
VNDVRKFEVNGQTWYVMALHMNTDALWYSLSHDGKNFGQEHVLTAHKDESDLYIVAVGFVTDKNTIYGVLYGAGAVSSLDKNRIFAKWLQKKVVFLTEDGLKLEANAAYGPDRVLLSLPEGRTVSGRFHIYAEDGTTLLSTSETMTLTQGQVWRFEALPKANR